MNVRQAVSICTMHSAQGGAGTLVPAGSFAHFSSRRVKKTCRWHVFNADLGGYAAVAFIWVCNAWRKWAAGGRSHFTERNILIPH